LAGRSRATGGTVAGVLKATRRLHLLTSPAKPDVFMATESPADLDSAEISVTAVSESKLRHPSNYDAPTAS
jgi:hypothetical protein